MFILAYYWKEGVYNMKNKLHVGLDIGSTTIKIMILNEQLKPIYASYTRHL